MPNNENQNNMPSSLLGLIGYGVGSMVNYHSNQDANETNILMTELANQANERINERQMEHADRAAAEADFRTRQLYNDLYSPAARVRQLKEAGLSVGLMYGQGGAGGSGQAGQQATTPNAIPMQAARVNPTMNVEMTALMAQAAKQLAETEKIKTETKKTENELPEIQQRIKESEERIEKIKQDIAESQQRVENLVEEKLNIIADTTKKGEEAKSEVERQKVLKAQAEYNNALKDLTDIQIEWEGKISEATVKQIEAKTRELNASAAYLGVQKDVLEGQKRWLIQKAEEEVLTMLYNRQEILPKQREEIIAKVKLAEEQAFKTHQEGRDIELDNEVYNDLNRMLPGMGLGSAIKLVFGQYLKIGAGMHN